MIKDTAEWRKIGTSPMVLDWLENGFPIRLRNSQPPFRQLNRKLSEEHRNFITVHIQELLALGAIEQTTTPPMCVSPIAVVPKKNGKLRMILNLKRLNQNVIDPRFRYEKIDSIRLLCGNSSTHTGKTH